MSMNETYTKRTRIFIGRIVDGDDSTESRIFLILFLLYIWSHESHRSIWKFLFSPFLLLGFFPVLVYVEITPSGITANLVQLGTSMITSGFEQDLKLDPGSYSIDLDENTFDKDVSETFKQLKLFPILIEK